MTRSESHLAHVPPEIRSMVLGLTTTQLQIALADFLQSVRRLDDHQTPSLYVHDTAQAVRAIERMAGISDGWWKQAERAYKCARCRQASVAKAGRICSGCRTPLEAAA